MLDKKQTVSHLKAVRKLLDDPKKWHKGFYIGKANGDDASKYGQARCFCIRGAVIRRDPDNTGKRYSNSPNEIRTCEPIKQAIYQLFPSYGGCIVDFNDNWLTSHGMVIRVLDRAIEIAAN
jgi:hypothetical protein